jgi:hypothetical protein
MGSRGLVGEFDTEVLPDVVAAELEDRLACLLDRTAQECRNGVRRH